MLFLDRKTRTEKKEHTHREPILTSEEQRRPRPAYNHAFLYLLDRTPLSPGINARSSTSKRHTYMGYLFHELDLPPIPALPPLQILLRWRWSTFLRVPQCLSPTPS